MQNIYIKINSETEWHAAIAGLKALGCKRRMGMGELPYLDHANLCVDPDGDILSAPKNDWRYPSMPFTAALRMIEAEQEKGKEREGGINCKHVFTPLFPCHIVTISEKDRAAHIAALEAAGVKRCAPVFSYGLEPNIELMNGGEFYMTFRPKRDGEEDCSPAVDLSEAIARIVASRQTCEHVCEVHERVKS